MQNAKTLGYCSTCNRYTALTKHHLIPKKRHKHKRKTTSETRLQEIIMVCRTCHDGIHDLYDERTLAEELDTLEKLLQDDKLQKHFSWVSKLKKGLR